MRRPRTNASERRRRVRSRDRSGRRGGGQGRGGGGNGAGRRHRLRRQRAAGLAGSGGTDGGGASGRPGRLRHSRGDFHPRDPGAARGGGGAEEPVSAVRKRRMVLPGRSRAGRASLRRARDDPAAATEVVRVGRIVVEAGRKRLVRAAAAHAHVRRRRDGAGAGHHVGVVHLLVRTQSQPVVDHTPAPVFLVLSAQVQADGEVAVVIVLLHDRDSDARTDGHFSTGSLRLEAQAMRRLWGMLPSGIVLSGRPHISRLRRSRRESPVGIMAVVEEWVAFAARTDVAVNISSSNFLHH